ncbi:DNA-dependent RNA polymerase II [Marasmius sp. AFHP31]|nr:DNA-dependent RNA polymerase II [Marasmius sp. AFHP31]
MLQHGMYDKLEDDRLIAPGTGVRGEDVTIGETAYIPPDSEETRRLESGAVNQVSITTNFEGQKFVKVRVHSTRIPQIGDKFASGYRQKDTDGFTYRQEDIPFTSSVFLSKVTTLIGKEGDATPFTGFTVESVFTFLRQRRYQSRGLEVMYHGHGRKPHAQVYLRPTYYQRLKHMVDDKIHSRARGPVQTLARQPVVGRSRDGGLHFGEMERGCMISHGIAGFLNERFCEARDAYCLDVCDICGRTAIANPEQQNFECRACKNKTAVYQLHIPYAAKLLSQEL